MYLVYRETSQFLHMGEQQYTETRNQYTGFSTFKSVSETMYHFPHTTERIRVYEYPTSAAKSRITQDHPVCIIKVAFLYKHHKCVVYIELY